MPVNSLFGPLSDVARDAGWDDPPERVGFFTDTSVCIGCKACEVACKEWNGVPEDGLSFLGLSYDHTGGLSASTWRHVAFVERTDAPSAPVPPAETPGGGAATSGAATSGAAAAGREVTWLMSSDVCKHCTHAACLDVCPTGAIFRTELGTVVIQNDVCNGCGYCVSACPYGVITLREGDGRAWKCTLCYDRLEDGLTPACAKACPTQSIQFGKVSELRERAGARVKELHEQGVTRARLYGESPDDGIGGAGAMFLLLDEPETYGLPPDPVVCTRDLTDSYKRAAMAAGLFLVSGMVALLAGGRAGGRSRGRSGGRG